MNYKDSFFCFNCGDSAHINSIIIIILFNLTFFQISFSIEEINNNQIGNVQSKTTENEIKKVVDQGILYSKSENNKTKKM